MLLLKKIFKLTGLLIILASVLASWFWMDYRTFIKSGVINDKTHVFTIHQGNGLSQVVAALVEQQIITKPVYFKLMAKLADKETSIKAGEYLLQPGMSPAQVLDIFSQGKVLQHQLTIPEGWTFVQIVDSLRKSRLNTQNLDNITNGELELQVDFEQKKYPIEGFCLTLSFENIN